jgi:SNF2 family DNA or RNA helicase
MPGVSLVEQRANRRATIEQRVEMAVKVVASDPDASWLVWCELNDESALAAKALSAVEVKGADTPEKKESALIGFAEGTIKRLVTKPTIAGFGMNFQVCHKVIFLGMSHSYEQYYQAVRRCWRFGQARPVTVDVVLTEGQLAIMENLKHKAKKADAMFDALVREMNNSLSLSVKREFNKGEVLPAWLS